MITEDPKVIAEKEGVHERIQAEIQHEEKEVEVAEEVMLEIPREWNAVPDLIMEDKKELIINETDNTLKRDEVVRGHRKQWKEDDICPEKSEHSPMVSRRAQNSEGFYSEDWDESEQEEDEWQMPDKWQRVSQMVFCGGCLEINPEETGDISRSCDQHQGGVCSGSAA